MWARYENGNIIIYPDGQDWSGQELTLEEALELAGSIYKAVILKR